MKKFQQMTHSDVTGSNLERKGAITHAPLPQHHSVQQWHEFYSFNYFSTSDI